jgi:predicted CoA-binding protein
VAPTNAPDDPAADERGSDGSVPDLQEAAMIPVKQAATDFLAHKKIAVTGVSRSAKDHGANVVYKRLRDRGYTVYAINPNADEVEGDPCFHDLASVPGGVDGVVIATSPAHADETVRECAELGIERVWMHRGPGPGSVSEGATVFGREHGMTVIDGGCPCMFGPTADTGHRIMHLLGIGHMPKKV